MLKEKRLGGIFFFFWGRSARRGLGLPSLYVGKTGTDPRGYLFEYVGLPSLYRGKTGTDFDDNIFFF
jgi:hypothetical protein